MKKILVLAFVLVVLFGCTRVDPGYVGIKVDLYGTQRGVQDLPLVTGMVWYNPFTTSVYKYPTFVQVATWTKNEETGRKGYNDEITYNSREGLGISADISFAFQINTKKAPFFYVKFRSDNIKEFTHGFLRNLAIGKFNSVASRYMVEEIYGGESKSQILKEVKNLLNEEIKEFASIDQFEYIGAVRIPKQVTDALDMKIKATQDAIRTENEIRQSKADAQKLIAKAEGEAGSVTIKAKAEANANRIIAESLTPNLVTYKAIQQWDGKRPMVEGQGTGLLMTIPVQQK